MSIKTELREAFTPVRKPWRPDEWYRSGVTMALWLILGSAVVPWLFPLAALWLIASGLVGTAVALTGRPASRLLDV